MFNNEWSMQAKIVKANLLKETTTDENCSIAENYRSNAVTIAQARVKPGQTTVAHHLEGVEEIYLIMQGKGKVFVDNLKPVEVEVGDLVVIPSTVSQKITNIGKTDLVFSCICTPCFTSECYVDEEKQ